MFGLKRKHREKIRAQPFPEAWENILQTHVAYYQAMNPADRAELHGHIQVFLDEKKFMGCGGLEITEEIQVIVAAQACVLLLHRDTDYYPGLHTIMVYPHHYFARTLQQLPDGTVMEGDQGRLGESWHHGPVVLSWDDVKRGAHDMRDGHNVVFHEFAHQLDGESGAEEGAPRLPRRSMYVPWARVMRAEYTHLLDDLEHHRRNTIDSYGATNPAEFFAVVTETFFEKPVALRRQHPDLYEQLRRFYQQDPAARFGSPSPPLPPAEE